MNSNYANPSKTDLPVRVIGYAWGQSYVDELLSFAVPALLAPGNLPAVASQLPCELVLVTEERFFASIAADPVIAKIRQLCSVRLVGLDDLITRSDKYGMALTYVLHRAFADLGPAMTDTWLMFFNADFIIADGSLKNLLAHLRAGARIVASPSYCAIKEQVIPELKRRVGSDPTALRLAPREMAQLILRHRHNTIRGKTINQDGFHLLQTDQFYWQVDDTTLLGHQMPVAIVGMRPERYLSEPNAYWDHGLISEFCPSADAKVLGDSDEFLMLELRGGDVAADQIVAGLPDPKDLGKRMITWVTPYQASFARQPLTLHAAELPPGTPQARQQLEAFVTKVLSFAPPFHSHLDHPQWTYHWPEFMKIRHEFLSNKLGLLTEIAPPPRSLPAVDQVWWRLDGVRKSIVRKKRFAAAERDQQIEALVTALNKVNAASASNSARGPGAAFDYCGYAMMNLDPTSQGPHCIGARQQTGMETADKIRQFERAIADAEQQYDVAIASLDQERAMAENEYNDLVQTRVRSAGIPIIDWLDGPELQPSLSGSLRRRVARSTFYAVFGCWPAVTVLHPFWSCSRPLMQAIADAKAAGASDVLLVGDPPQILPGITGFPGRVARVSHAGFFSGSFHKALEPRQQFDLSVLELKRDDLADLVDRLARLLPYMRPNGRIVIIHMEAGRPLGELPLPMTGEPVFAGSRASLRAMAVYVNALALNSGRPLYRLVRCGLRLALNLPLFWWANRAEAAAAKQGRKPALDYRTSLTITIPVAAFAAGSSEVNLEPALLRDPTAYGTAVDGPPRRLADEIVPSRPNASNTPKPSLV